MPARHLIALLLTVAGMAALVASAVVAAGVAGGLGAGGITAFGLGLLLGWES